MIVEAAARSFAFLFRGTDAMDPRRRRVAAILKGACASLGSRVVGLFVNFASVPLTIGYLGPERYGVWVTILSLLAWLNVADLGLGNGFGNAITTAAALKRPDLVRTHISNALALLSVIACVTGLAVIVAWPYIDWGALFGVSRPAVKIEVGNAIAAAFVIFWLQFPLSITNRVYLAYQEGWISSYWGIIGNILGLGSLLLLTHVGSGLIWLVVAVSGTSLLVNLCSTIWLFTWHKKHLSPSIFRVDLSLISDIGCTGSQFFLIQIMALVTFQVDNLVISAYLGAARVPEYSLTSTLFGYALLIQNLVFAYMWAAYSEAIALHDIAWIRRMFHLNLVGGLVLTTFISVGGIFVARPFIGWWASPEVVPDSALVGWMAVWTVVNGFTNPIACLLAAAGRLRYQIMYSGLATISNVALSIYLVQRIGVVGAIAATVVSYLVFVCGPTFIDVEQLLKALQRAVPSSPVSKASGTVSSEVSHRGDDVS